MIRPCKKNLSLFKSISSKKIILFLLSFLLFISNVNYVFSSDNSINNNSPPPILRMSQVNNVAKAEWAIEMDEEDVLIETSFENGQERPNLNYNGFDGQQSFTTETANTGMTSIKVGKTTGKNGNYWNPPDVDSDYSLAGFGTKKIPNGTNLSLSFSAKTTKSSNLNPWGNGGYENKITYYDNIITKPVNIGDRTISLNNVNGLTVGSKVTYDVDDMIISIQPNISSIDKENNTITIDYPVTRKINIGERLSRRIWKYAFNFPTRTIQNKDWELFNANTVVEDDPYYDVGVRGGTFYITTTSNDITYYDDVKFGYATKAQLFRDGTNVYEGFLSDYEDKAATDKATPNIPVVKQEINGSNLNLTWNSVADNGTLYNYQIKGLKRNNVVINSVIQPITVTSGIKNYEVYVNGKLHGTTTGTSYEIPNNFETNNIQVRAVDNAGNKSNLSNSVNLLKLQSQKQNDGVQLDWNYGSLTNENVYKIYRNDNHSNDFQPIQAKEHIKVLEVYPNISSLKDWTRDYGQGKITVDSVPIESFNSNPNQINNYDVVVFGFWDSNNSKDISLNTVPILEKYLDSGKGVLFGHDTIRQSNPNFSKMAKYVNMLPSGGLDNTIDTNIVIEKKGLLTKYPWDIGDIGTVLNIPATHALFQIPNGEIWMTFQNSNQYYLTTWNNAGMIQTGHSSGQATPDEQKLIMNTLFYLAQITSNTSWLDKSAIDIDSPTVPTVTKIDSKGMTGTITFNQSVDIGTKYDYKVGTGDVFSNTVTETITSGLKHYEIYLDGKLYGTTTNTSYNFTIPNGVDLTKPIDLYVLSVDNAGNKSETLHHKLEDKVSPTAIHTINPSGWTNQDVTITVKASDVGYGVKRIKLPSGTYVDSSTATHTVTQNGTYNFIIEDLAGNTTTYPVVITNIDKVKPTGSFIINNGAAQTNNRNVTLKVTHNDNLSGINQIKVTENGVSKTFAPSNNLTTIPWTVSQQAGKKVFTVTLCDRAGNETILSNSIIYTNLEITGLTLSNVVNPKTFNSKNPFTAKKWVFSPQPMSAGGNISFNVNLSAPVDLPSHTDTVRYTLRITDPKGSVKLLNGNMARSTGTTYAAKVTVPKETPTNSKVELLVTANRQSSGFSETVYYPNKDSSSIFAHIGTVTTNINKDIRFNEIK